MLPNKANFMGCSIINPVMRKHLVIGQRYKATDVSVFHWSSYGSVDFTVKDRAVGYQPGPGCSKLTRSLVNVSLKFQTLISQIRQYFLLKKYKKLLQKLLSFFQQKI